MNEWLMIALMVTSVACFAIGGTGYRFVKFTIMPLLFGIIMYFSHVLWWHCLGMAVTMGGAITFGIGEKVPWWRKIIVVGGWSFSTLWIGWSVWQVIAPILILLFYFLSNNRITSRFFPWKICEASFGFWLACILCTINYWK